MWVHPKQRFHIECEIVQVRYMIFLTEHLAAAFSTEYVTNRKGTIFFSYFNELSFIIKTDGTVVDPAPGKLLDCSEHVSMYLTTNYYYNYNWIGSRSFTDRRCRQTYSGSLELWQCNKDTCSLLKIANLSWSHWHKGSYLSSSLLHMHSLLLRYFPDHVA